MDDIDDLLVWKQMAQFSLDMLCAFSRDGMYAHVSEASCSIIGYRSDELIGRHYSGFVEPKHLPATEQAAQDALDGKKTTSFENCLIHKNGKRVPVLWSVTWSEEVQLCFCVARDISEIKARRKVHIEREQRYQTLFNSNPDILFIEDLNGFITEVNDRFTAQIGWSKDTAAGSIFKTLLSSGYDVQYEEAFKLTLTGRPASLRVELTTPVGECRFYDVDKHPIKVHGKIVGVQTIAKDVTPIVHSYEKLKQQADHLDNILESIRDAFFTIDHSWNFTYVNQEAERMLNVKREDLIGRNMWECFPEEVNGQFHRQYRQAFLTNSAAHFTAYYARTDTWFEVKANPCADGLSIYFNDIGNVIKYERELEKLSLVAGKTNNSVIMTDSQLRIEWVNDGFLNIFGFDREEAVGEKITELITVLNVDSETFAKRMSALSEGEPIQFQAEFLRKSGETVWLSSEISPLFNKVGQFSGFIEVQTDITQLKLSEINHSKLAEDLYRQNNDLQQFTYIVSHNLRAPVANVIGLSQILAREGKDYDLFDASLKNLENSATQLDEVLKDMNTILSIRDGKGSLEMEQVSIALVLEQAIISLKEQLVNCSAEVSADLEQEVSVRANRAYLYSIFHNLLSNSVKYRDESRKLKIAVMFERLDNGVTTITVTDNGLGFDIKKAGNNLFKLYKRFHRNMEGKGIGLYLIKAHMEAMGGRVTVESKIGIGTSFSLYFPGAEM